MPASLQFNLTDFDRVDRLFDRLSLLDPSVLMTPVLGAVESQTAQRISVEKTAPDGTAWPEWSKKYGATRGENKSLLQDSGALFNDLAFELQQGGNQGVVFVTVVYAGAHQDPVAVGMPSGYPQRQFFGLSAQNVDDLDSLLEMEIIDLLAVN